MSRLKAGLFSILIMLSFFSIGQPVASFVVHGDTNLTPVPVCQGYVTQFTSVSTGVIASYSWTFATGNPSTSTNATVNVIWNSLGTKTCSLTVTDTSGATNTINFQVIVSNIKPSPTFGFLNDVCSSDPGKLLTQGAPSGGTYFGSGVTNNTFYPGVADTGYHTLGYIYTAPNGCTDTAFSTIYVKKGPNASLLELNNFSNCNGFSFADPDFLIELYDQSTSQDSIVLYEIIWGDGSLGWDSTSFLPGLTHTYSGQGIFLLQFILTTLNGCTDTAKYSIVNTTNPASLNIVNPGGTNGCAPVTIVFPLSTSNVDTTVTYTIAWGDTKDTTFKHPPPAFITHTYDTTSCILPGGYFTITATAENACVTTQSTIQGPFVTQPAKAEFIANPGCVGVPHSLPNKSIPGFTNACSRLSTYIWDFGDGSPPVTVISTLPLPPSGTHTWMAAGTYNVQLITVAIGANCPGDTIIYPVCIEDKIITSINVTDTIGCAPVTPTITNLSDTVTYCTSILKGWFVDNPNGWTLTGGSTLTDIEPNFSFTNPGIYTLSYYQFNSCGGDTISQKIHVRDVPTVSIPPTVSHCDTAFVNTLTNTSHHPTFTDNGAPITSYLWRISPSVPFTLGTDSTFQYPSFMLSPNTYTITVFATNACGTDSTVQNVVVNQITNGGFVMDADTGCSPLLVNVQSTSTSGVQHTWYVNNVVYSTQEDTSMVLVNTGVVDIIYNIKLIVFAGIGCSDTIIQDVTVHPNPTAHFTAQKVCVGSITGFVDSSSAAVAPIASWLWNFGDGGTSTVQNPQHTYGASGNYTVSLLVTDTNNCTSSLSKPVIVYSPPIAAFNLNYSSYPDSACIQDSVHFIDSSYINLFGTPITQYAWDVFNDGFLDDTTQNSSYVFSVPGSYPVKLTVTNASGCTDFVFDTVHVSRPPTPYFSLSSYGGCTPVTVVANDSSSGYILNYNWRFYTLDSNNNQIVEYTSVTQNPNPIPPFQANILTNKTIFAELTTSNGCYTASYTDTINIKPIPIPFFAFSSDTGCSPFSVLIQVDGLATGQPDSIVFNFGDGSPATTLFPIINILPNGDTLFTWNQQAHTFSYLGNGLDTVYYVTLYASNECGDSSYTVPINVRNRGVQSFFTASSNVGCSPLNVTFTDYSFAAISKAYCFDYDTINNVCTGAVYFGANPTFNFTQPGVYVVAQFANNVCGSDTSYQVIDVRPNPVPQFVIPSVICADDTVFFQNSSTVSSGTIWGYRWDFGDGDSSFLSSPYHVYDTVGTFMVCLNVVTNSACDSTICVPITVNGRPKTNFTFPTNVCQNLQPIQFTNLSTNPTGNIISYEWRFGDGNVSTQINPLHSYSAPGTYNVKLVLTNDDFCKDSLTQQIIIFPVPVADFAYTIQSGDSCGAPQTIVFTNNSNGAGGYYWDFNYNNNPGQDTAVLMHPTHVYTQPGTYQVMLISKNGLGCQDTIFKEIRIHPIPVADFVPDVLRGCAPLTVFFDNRTTLPTGFNDSIFYTWHFGDGTIAVDKHVYHTYRNAGTYSVKLVARTQFACADSILYSNLITVFPVPEPVFTYVPIVFGIYQFTQASVGGTPPYTFNWNFGDGSPNSTLPHPEHEFVIDRVGYEFGFNVCLTVTDANGCDSTLCDTVNIGSFTLYVPNAMSPGGDGEEAIFLPKGQGLETYHLQIFDRWGNKLWETDKLDDETASPVEGWDGTYKGEPVPAGVYVWRIDASFANGIVWRGQSLDGKQVSNSGTITILR